MRLDYNALLVALVAFTVVGGSQPAEAGRKDQNAYERAESVDTVAAYENFVAAYPRSKFVEDAQRRLSFLRQVEQEVAEKRAAEVSRLAKLKEYVVGETTLADFEADGWSAEDLFYGFTGILAAHLSTASAEYNLGRIAISRPDPRAAEIFETSFRVAMAFATEAEEGSVFDLETRGFSTTLLCTLRFSDSVLAALDCRKE